MSEVDDLVIQLFADHEVGLRERIAELEDRCVALEALAQSRADDALTLRIMLLQAWQELYEVHGYWFFKHHPKDDERNAA